MRKLLKKWLKKAQKCIAEKETKELQKEIDEIIQLLPHNDISNMQNGVKLKDMR